MTGRIRRWLLLILGRWRHALRRMGTIGMLWGLLAVMIWRSITILIGRAWVVDSVRTNRVPRGRVNIQRAVTIALKHLIVEGINLLLKLL